MIPKIVCYIKNFACSKFNKFTKQPVDKKKVA